MTPHCWAAVTITDRAGAALVHVVPLDDLREHDMHAECWCRPTPDHDADTVIVHHAMDRREDYEGARGRRLS